MAAEEDKKFDAVLGGFLVNDLRIRAGHLHCPESDTLAAYHERSLLPEEMNSWKEHIVGCARCQAILTELEATDSIPLQVSAKGEVLLTAPAMPAAVASQAGKTATTKAPEKSFVTPISRGVRWQWLVPAGALAAGLLVWVAWHENRTQQAVKTPAEVTTAKLEPPPATQPPSATLDNRQSVSMDEVAHLSKGQVAVGGAAPAQPAPQARVLKQFEKPDSRAKVALATPITGQSSKQSESSMPPADKEAGARTNAAVDSLSAANRKQNRPAQDAKAGVAGALSQTVEVQTLTADVQNQQAQQNLQAQQSQLSEQKTSGPNPSRHLEKKKAESPPLAYRAAAAQPATPPPPVPAPATAFNEDASLRLAGAISPHLIPSPNRKVLWRAGHAGMIEFSSDGGASWSRQTSNVFVDLTAGSAPSEKVCWIVGRAGTILLTSDAGVHWATLHAPLDEDLGGVRATDALHATIWNLANTKVFETSDGGITWKSAASQ
ncbi:MAG TPA: hypothetical protein VGR55_09760 [Candidatus Acidoferrum sp.]|nr:hypothetical protein [Candidatus Acidoferrum sp.]